MTQFHAIREADRTLQDIGRRSVRGGAATVAAQATAFAVNTGATMILARLLTPADFGLVAMVRALMGLPAIFRDLGLSTVTVQRAHLTHEQVSGLFWTNVLVSSLLTVLVALLSPAVAWFYGEPRLVWITSALGLVFLLEGLTAQHLALLRRHMAFTSLAGIQVGASLIGVLVGLAAAWQGLGYWALVMMSLGTSATSMVLAWVLYRWRPAFRFPLREMRALLAFGSNITGFNLLNYFARNLDNVLIGKVWGPSPLGLYAKAC